MKNLIIIHTDEHNLRTLGCYRNLMPRDQAFPWGDNVQVETPNIDWLAKNGCLFENFITPFPICQPSRATFFTGKHYNKVIQFDSPKTWVGQYLKRDSISFANFFKDSGYNNYYVGKWHLDGPKEPGWSPDCSFGFDHKQYMFNSGHCKVIKQSDDGSFDFDKKCDASSASEKNYTTDWLSDKAIECIKNNKSNPFLLTLSIPDPHEPNDVREPYRSMFNDLDFKLPFTMRHAVSKPDQVPGWAQGGDRAKHWNTDIIAKYFGMVKCIDDNVGKIISFLRSSNLLNNTVIVFTSDHGDLLYEHRLHNKAVPYRCSINTPMIIFDPSSIPTNKIINTPCSMVDFCPTILDLCGISFDPKSFDGDSQLKRITNPSNQVDDYRIVYSRNWNWLAAIDNHLKLIVSLDEDLWLFDSRADLNEINNVADNPFYSDSIKKLLINLYNQIQAFEPDILQKDIGIKLKNYINE